MKHFDHNLEDKIRSLSKEVNIPSHLKTQLKADILQKITILPTPQKGILGFRLATWAPALVMIGVIVTSGTAVMANSAKPGDLLYPMDIWAESVSQRLVRDESAKAKLYASLGDERVTELE